MMAFYNNFYTPVLLTLQGVCARTHQNGAIITIIAAFDLTYKCYKTILCSENKKITPNKCIKTAITLIG
jgi:hypothetical protein